MLPGLAVADALVARGHARPSIHFVGSERGVEAAAGARRPASRSRCCPGAASSGGSRWPTSAPCSAWCAACVRASAWSARLPAEVVVVLGGYAERAVRRRPRSCGVCRSSCCEQNARARRGQPAGRPVRQGRRRCRSPDTDLPRPCVTGNPVRPEILAVDRDRDRATARRAPRPARRPHGPRPCSAARWAPGGSTRRGRGLVDRVGATASTSPCATWSARATGTRSAGAGAGADPRAASVYQRSLRGPTWTCCSAAADVAVTPGRRVDGGRARRVGLPAVLVPLPGATGDHQTANARALVDAGGGGARARRRARRRATGRRARRAARRPGPAGGDGEGGPHAWPGPTPPTGSPALVEEHGAVDGDRPCSISPRRVASTSSASAARGMSAIATVLAAMGHHVSGQRPQGLGRPRAAARRPASTFTSAIGPSTSRRRRRGGHLDRDPRHQPRGAAARERGHARCCGGPRSSPPSPRPRRTIAVAGTHGKTTTSSMLALVLRRGGPAPVVHHRRRGQRDRQRRGVGRRRPGSWSRPTRATARSSSSRARPWSSPTSSPTTSTTTAASTRWSPRSTASWPSTPGPAASCAPTIPSRRASAGPHGAVTYGTASDADYRIVDARAGRRRAVASGSCTTAESSARSRLPVPGPAQRPQRGRGAGDRPSRSARRSRPAARASAATPAWPAGSSSGASATASRSSTTTPTCPARSRAALGRRPRAATGDGSCACSSRTATAARPPCGATSPTRSSTPTCSCVTDVYAAGEAPRPGVTGKLSSTRCSTPIRGRGWRSCPARADVVRYLAPRAAPRRPVPDARRGRPHHRCPTSSSAADGAPP